MKGGATYQGFVGESPAVVRDDNFRDHPLDIFPDLRRQNEEKGDVGEDRHYEGVGEENAVTDVHTLDNMRATVDSFLGFVEGPFPNIFQGDVTPNDDP